MDDVVKIRFLRGYRHETMGSFNVGEGAAFPAALAASLIAAGTAQTDQPVAKTVDAPGAHKMVTQPAKKKGSPWGRT